MRNVLTRVAEETEVDDYTVYTTQVFCGISRLDVGSFLSGPAAMFIIVPSNIFDNYVI